MDKSIDKQIIHGKELEFNEKAHHYTWGGNPVPGVTTILSCIGKPALIPWAAGMASDYWLKAIKSGRTDYENVHKESKSSHRKKAEAAASAGQEVHKYAECFFKNEPKPQITTDEAWRGVEAFHGWMNKHNVKVISSERKVFSKSHYYAGTCDFIAEIDGVLGVGDIKTSSGIYPEMRFQTAAYQHAIQEEDCTMFPVRWIVRFDKKTAEFEVKSFYDFDLDFAGFNAALVLHKTLQLMK